MPFLCQDATCPASSECPDDCPRRQKRSRCTGAFTRRWRQGQGALPAYSGRKPVALVVRLKRNHRLFGATIRWHRLIQGVKPSPFSGHLETFDIVARIVDNQRYGIDIRGAMTIALQKLSCPMPIPRLVASLSKQTLTFIRGGDAVRIYPISTAKNGAGERMGSGCTPRGRHVIRAKIGACCPVGTVFVGRRATGESYSPKLAERLQGRDWILTRIAGYAAANRGETGLVTLIRCGVISTSTVALTSNRWAFRHLTGAYECATPTLSSYLIWSSQVHLFWLNSKV